jgi:hypothetical protein
MTVLGSGPVSPAQSPAVAVTSFIGSAWSGARVTWITTRRDAGPVLIRGRELSGPHAVGFGSGHVPYDELQLLTPVSRAPGAGEWPSFTRVRGPGCYAYQVDGTSFSTVVVFRVP